MTAMSTLLPTWYRAFAVIVGLISIALALVVLADPALGLFLLVFLLAFALLVMGIDRIVTGFTGHVVSQGALFGVGFAPGPGGASPPTGPGTPPKP